jgi:hypothetical protein
LFLGTAADNARDMYAKGRNRNQNSSKQFCKRGHPFDEANTIHRSNGSRECRACAAEYKRNWRAPARKEH